MIQQQPPHYFSQQPVLAPNPSVENISEGYRTAEFNNVPSMIDIE